MPRHSSVAIRPAVLMGRQAWLVSNAARPCPIRLRRRPGLTVRVVEKSKNENDKTPRGTETEANDRLRPGVANSSQIPDGLGSVQTVATFLLLETHVEPASGDVSMSRHDSVPAVVRLTPAHDHRVLAGP